MEGIIDRFEGEYAVIETGDRSMVHMPKVLLPKDAKEGDVISIHIDREKTEKRRHKIERLARDLWDS